MKKFHRGKPEFTHFGSIPFIRAEYRDSLAQLQTSIRTIFKTKKLDVCLKQNNANLFHLTLSMLTMPHLSTQEKTKAIMQKTAEQFIAIMKNCVLQTSNIKYFTHRPKNPNQTKSVNVIYLDLKKNEEFQKLRKLIDFFIRMLLKQQIVVHAQLRDMHIEFDHNTGLFKNPDPHITLFRCENLKQNEIFLESFSKIQNLFEGKKLSCDSVDISTRWAFDETNFYTPLYRINLRQQKQMKKEKKQIISKLQKKRQQQMH